LEQKARECRRKIKDARKNIDLLAGKYKNTTTKREYTLHLDGHFEPEATAESALLKDIPKTDADIKKGDKHLSFDVDTKAYKDEEMTSLKEAFRKGYLFDVFQTLLRAKLVQNERTFFTEIRKMRLQELIAEAERCQVEEGGPDGDRVYCPYQCSCATPVMIQQLVNSQQLPMASKSKKLPSTIPASMIRMLPTLRCRCNAWSMYEKLCKERQELRRKLRADPAEAFTLDDDKILKYIRTEIFGEPEANYKANKNFVPGGERANMGGFFRWFMTYVLEWEGTFENSTAKNSHVFGKEKYLADLKTAIGGTAPKDYKQDWSGMGFFKNLVDVAQNLRSRTDCCRILQPGKLVAECLLYANQRGCFVQCCTKGREIFERVYCDKDTGSLAFICQFVTDFLLASRNVPLSGSVAGKAFHEKAAGDTIETVEYKQDGVDDRKHGMKVSPSESVPESLEIKEYWKKLTLAMFEVMDTSIFKKNALVKTYSEELARNYRARVVGTAKRLHEVNTHVGTTKGQPDQSFLYLHEGDLRAIKLLKEHRMIGGNPSPPSNPPNPLDAEWDPFRSPKDAALAHVSHMDSLPKEQSFWADLVKLEDAKPGSSTPMTVYKTDVGTPSGGNPSKLLDNQGDQEAKDAQQVIEKSMLLIALESSNNFKDKFKLEEVKKIKNIELLHSAIVHLKDGAFDKQKDLMGVFLPQDSSDPHTGYVGSIETFLEFETDDDGKSGSVKKISSVGSIDTTDADSLAANTNLPSIFKPEFLKELKIEDRKPNRGTAGVQWNEDTVNNHLKPLLNELATKIVQLYKQFKLEPMISRATANGKAEAKLVGFSAQEAAAADSLSGPDDDVQYMSGASYRTAEATTASTEDTKFTETGSGDRYDYLSTVVLCNREIDCSSGFLLTSAPGMSLLSPHVDLLLLSAGERARREDSFKLLKSLLDVLFKWHAPNQHWATMARAIMKSVESVEC
jgi:hypothetical protein